MDLWEMEEKRKTAIASSYGTDNGMAREMLIVEMPWLIEELKSWRAYGARANSLLGEARKLLGVK